MHMQHLPLRECNDNSLQSFTNVIVELIIITQTLIPRPHKVTVREVKHLMCVQTKQYKLVTAAAVLLLLTI